MKRILTLGIACIIWTSCQQYERIYIDDVEQIVSNQLDNNMSKIRAIEDELRQLKIDSLRKNEALLNRLRNVHSEILNANDSIDASDKQKSLGIAKKLIDRWFKDHLWIFNTKPYTTTDETPRALLKLNLAMLENDYILWQKGKIEYSGAYMKFDDITALIVVDQHVVKKGEKLTGQIVLAAKAPMTDAPEQVKKVLLNGQIVMPSKDGWRFEIIPMTNAKQGIIEYDLSAEVLFSDTISYKGRERIYILD